MQGQKRPRPIRVEGDAAYITLTRGLTAVIDVADLGLVSDRNWRAQGVRRTYATWTDTNAADGPAEVLLQRLIAQPDGGQVVAFRDGNTLNCRRANLVCTTKGHATHLAHALKLEPAATLGVRQVGTGFSARINHGGKRLQIGPFETRAEARAAYIGASRILSTIDTAETAP